MLRALGFSVIFFLTCATSAWAAFEPVGGQDLLNGQPAKMEPGKKGMVVVFLSDRCPCSNSHVSTLKDLSKAFPDFQFVAVHSNGNEPADAAKTYFAAQNLPFPVLQDSNFTLANRFGAAKTPHAFVITAQGEVVFRGGVTDSHNASEAQRNYLREALDDVQAGHKVRTDHARALGCAISRGST